MKASSPMADFPLIIAPPKRAEKVYPPLGIVTWWDFVIYCWMMRPCFVCGKCGKCIHRQPEAECVEEFEAIKRSYRDHRRQA